MKTAVLLRRRYPRTALLHGTLLRVVPTSTGDVGLLDRDELAAYLLELPGVRRLHVFRTLALPKDGGTRLPGVWPAVHLLASFEGAGRIQRIEALFRYLAHHRWSPSLLSEAFWLRLSHVLGGRLPRHKVLVSLLAAELPFKHQPSAVGAEVAS